MKDLKNLIPIEVLTKRDKERAQDDLRSPFYRDTTAIIHSAAFRRLKHKTQVFFAPSNDHICTRIEHVLHVASIASAICTPLGLNTELAWAIGMGHDLGHAPFGHVGEDIISEMYQKRGLGKFQHELHSLRVVDFVADHGKGLNLTYAVKDGIVSHNGEQLNSIIIPDENIKDFSKITDRKNLRPSTYEGVVVRFSDSIAYLGRDFEDATRLGLLEDVTLPEIVIERLGKTNGEIINSLVIDLINTTRDLDGQGMGFSEKTFEAMKAMMDFNYKMIYKSDLLNGYTNYYRRLLNLITDYLDDIYKKYDKDEQGYLSEKNVLASGFYKNLIEMEEMYLEKDGNTNRLVLDYVSGMTDNFALDSAKGIITPEFLNDDLEHRTMNKYFDKQSKLD